MKTKSLVTTALLAALIPTYAMAQRTGGPRPPQLDPETMVTTMIADYDADESNTLSNAELVAAFNGIRAQNQSKMAANCPQGGKSPMASAKGFRQGSRRGGPPDADEMTALLLENFDANADAALSSEELLKGLTWMHDNRPAPGGSRPVTPPPATDN